MRIILITLALMANIYAGTFGSFSLVVLKDGIALQDQEFSIIETNTKKSLLAKTDEDGYFFSKLEKGNYQIQLLARENGKVQAFVRKNILVESNKESQVIVSLKSDNSLAFIDTETPQMKTTAKVDTNATILKGSIILTLASSENKKKVQNATVFVKGTDIEAKSNEKGFLELDLPQGEHIVTIIHQDFSAQTLKVTIIANELISKSIELSPASMELDEFVVLAPHVEGSVAASISQERNSDSVGNVLGSEQFSKSGDSTVASALKRVSGITIVGGKYVYVRGLGDRYSTVMLNGLHIPSPEPTKRVVPLDIFPTTVVESITIQKSYTSDLPASFGGGTVLIKTKEIPKDDGYIKLGVEVLTNNSTGKEATTNLTNSTPLPPSVLTGGNNTGGVAVTKDVINARTLNRQKITLNPGMKVELSAGKSYDISENFTIGTSATFYYKNTSDNDTLSTDKYFYDTNTQRVNHDSSTDTDITTLTTEMSAMLNVGLDYYKNNSIKYTFFTTSKITDRTLLSSIDYVGLEEDREKTYYEYVDKTVTTHQVIGKNDLRFSNSTDGYFDNLVIDWAGESATALRDEPGSVEYNYLHQTSGLNWDRKTWYYYFKLEDEVNNYRADFSLPFIFNGNENYTKAGIFLYNKTRTFDSRRFKMLSNNFTDMPEDIDTIYAKYSNDLDFSSSYINTDSYEATQEVSALYLKQLLSVTKDFDVIASIRQESSTQQLTDAASVYDPLITDDLFPSLGLTYRFDNDDMQLRFAYAETISRPDFREFSNSNYKDPITENIVFGNPNLQATYISHLDLKYEWYLSNDEIFSIALFSKEFINPIEKVIKQDDTQGGTYLETYQNADSASSYGVEIDYRKRFGFVHKSLEELLFTSNVALIESTIVLNKDPNNQYTSRLTSKTRAMQGQSPYVLNLGLGYDNPDNADSAFFLFNQIGERIVALGTDLNEDTYQEPFAKLDFVLKYSISEKKSNDFFSYALRFRVMNLLDSTQEITQGDNIISTFKPGRYYSLKLDIAY